MNEQQREYVVAAASKMVMETIRDECITAYELRVAADTQDAMRPYLAEKLRKLADAMDRVTG